MARVRPFAGLRFAAPETDISAMAAPPYDVISPEQRAELLSRDPHNIVALELPYGPLDPTVANNRYETGRRTWDSWRADGVLVADAPSVYVLEQTFTLQGQPIRRRAFIAAVGLEPFDAGIVLPHERTLPKALGDRFELIMATGANFSQVFGLFDDPACETDALFAEVMASEPVATATDDDNVKSTLWASTDADVARRLEELLAPKQVFIADGHHRYTTALAHCELMRERSGGEAADAPAEFVMMALVNMDDPELRVLPTHRVANAEGTFHPAAFHAALAEHFIVEECATAEGLAALERITEPAFLVKTPADVHPLVVRLKPDTDLRALMPAGRSEAWMNLDVAVLQELVLDPLLGIHPDRPETLDRLDFVKDADQALRMSAENDAVFVLRATRLGQLRDVALAGETMPQKSTYFYPKLLSGLVMRAAR
ncbi:MAG TPA: DUF1015 domain-containing protein [Coriobacteriia bacterium]|nr:DUF1015 domain-containing protein [Coriobacteriia bacterium]